MVMLVVAAALTNAEGRVLLARRPAGKQHAGLWEFPGGKVEAGETPDAALVRELREELGIEINHAALAPVTFSELPGDRHLVLLLYRCRSWSGDGASDRCRGNPLGRRRRLARARYAARGLPACCRASGGVLRRATRSRCRASPAWVDRGRVPSRSGR